MDVKLNYTELESLWKFVNDHRDKLGEGLVHLKISSESGIGTSKTVFIYYNEDEGIFKDVTDYVKW
jgi:hypothetical protein